MSDYTAALAEINTATPRIPKNDRNTILQFYRLRAKCYTQLGREDEAIEFLNRAINLKDSIYNEEMTLASSKTKSAFQLEKKEAEIKSLRLENEHRQQRLLQIAALAFLTIAILVLSILYYNLSLRKKKDFAEMKALRAQMNPHFIFNSLNSINRYIIKADPEKASFYLTQFSRLIRLILENSKTTTISLEMELKALQLYVELETLRFANKFTSEISVSPDIDPASIVIPPLILQPYVENAIWHGLMKKKDDRKLKINLFKTDNLLQILIEDNGAGRSTMRSESVGELEKKSSLGMSITQQRLRFFARKKRNDVQVEIVDLKTADGSAAGTRVLISLPIVKGTASQIYQ